MKRIHTLAFCVIHGLLLNRDTLTKPKLNEYFQIQARLLSSAIWQLPLYVLSKVEHILVRNISSTQFFYMWKRKELITANSDVANGNSHRWWDLIAQKSSLKTIWNLINSDSHLETVEHPGDSGLYDWHWRPPASSAGRALTFQKSFALDCDNFASIFSEFAPTHKLCLNPLHLYRPQKYLCVLYHKNGTQILSTKAQMFSLNVTSVQKLPVI